MTTMPRVSIPVTVVVGRRMVSRSGWSTHSWRVVGIVSGDNLPGGDARGALVHSDGEEEHFLWGGLRLDLYRDAADAYWQNLLGKQPSLFILCAKREEDGMLEPLSVTADMHEASSGLEGDDEVFSVPIPPEIYRRLENFVVEYNVPQERKKRKRTDWTADEPS